MNENRNGEMICERAREEIQKRIDGDEPPAGLDAHLEACFDCRAFQEEMQGLQDGLAGLPELEFPDEALEEVWKRTIRRREPAWFHWRLPAAAAAVLAVLLAGAYFTLRDRGPRYTEAEVARATLEAKAALSVVREALHRSEQAAFGRVLRGEVSPALEKITIGVPDPKERGQRRTGA